MRYGDVVEIEAKGQVVSALVARSIEIAPHNPANNQPMKDLDGNVLPVEEHVDLVYLDPEAADQKAGPLMKVRELRHVAVNGLKSTVVAVMLLMALLLSSAVASAQQVQVRFAWATDYAYSNLMGQQPNTYTWSMGSAPSPGSCAVTPLNGASPFFVFGPTAHPYPQYIRDATPALSEVFTPSSTSLTGSTCGFNGSPTNSHVTFWVSSGTAGLYEALQNNASLGGTTYETNVMLDANWYRQMAALPGPPVTNTVITSTAAPGSTKVQIVDTTTTPWTWYSWSGTQYAVAGVGASPTLAGVNTYTAINNFQNAVTSFGVSAGTTGTLRLYSSGAAFTTTIQPATTPTGSYTATIPVLGAADTFAMLGVANTFSAANVFSAATTNFGVAGSTTGILKINSSGAAGSVSLTPATSTAAYTATLPANTGTVAELNLAQSFTQPITITPTASLVLGTSGSAVGQVIFNNGTSGTVTLAPTTGALGSVTATLPANTGTVAELNLAQTFTQPITITPTASLVLGATGSAVGQVIFNNATSGTVTLAPTTGALGSVTATLPANTGTVAELNLAQSFTQPITITPTASLVLGTAGSAVGQAIFNNATSGTITLAPPTGALGSITDTLAVYAGGLVPVFSCGATGTGNQTCSPSAANGKQQIYVGSSTLSGSTATITFPNTFTSTSTFFCTANDVTTRANPVQMVPASGTTATITDTTGASDVIQWMCAGN
jgi:ribosomal protein L11